MRFNVGFGTDIGRKRQQNQDHGGAFPDLGLFVVADGMGGHRGGETASAMAVETIAASIQEAERQPDWKPAEAIANAIQAANHAIHGRAIDEVNLQGMGTTTTALLFRGKELTIGHVGDSRAYYFRPEAIWQLTRDHSLVAEKLRAGLITREQMKTDRMRNVITRSVGFEPDVNVEVYEMTVQPGDIFLICSDGLSGLLEDSDLLSTIQRNLLSGNDIQRAVTELIEGANERGGDDNITAVMIQLLESEEN
jgi:protein phosphatase